MTTPEILPIFFDVSFDDVKLKTDLYLEASEKHEQGHVADINRWKAARMGVAGINGWELQGKARNDEAIEHDLKQVVLKLSGNKRPLGSKFLSWEVGQTSGVDDKSVRRRITSWQKGEMLGRGSFGDVYKGFSDDGFFFAVKEVCFLDQGSHGKESLSQVKAFSFCNLSTGR